MITPRSYQLECITAGIEKIQKHWLVYLAMEMRLGKTLCSLVIAREIKARRVLFITTRKAYPGVVADHALLDPAYEFTVTTHGMAKKFLNYNPDVVIVDETHRMGAFPKVGKTWSTIRRICDGRRVMMLSGTPSPESYSQLYHQLALSSFSPLARYQNFYRFADDFVDKYEIQINGMDITQYDRCDGRKLWPHIKHLFVTYSQKQAGFKSEVVEKFLRVPMSKDAVDIFRRLKRDRIFIAPNGQAAVCNGGAQMMNKLWQISSGTLIFDETVEGKIDPDGVVIDTSKASFIREFFFGRKIVIFYKFKAEQRMLKLFFPNSTDDFHKFNESTNLTGLVQIQSGSEGTNWRTAEALVYYNMDFSAKVYLQSIMRSQDYTRETPAEAYFVFSEHGIEEFIYKAVSNKQDFTYGWYREATTKGIRNTGQNQKVS